MARGHGYYGYHGYHGYHRYHRYLHCVIRELTVTTLKLRLLEGLLSAFSGHREHCTDVMADFEARKNLGLEPPP